MLSWLAAGPSLPLSVDTLEHLVNAELPALLSASKIDFPFSAVFRLSVWASFPKGDWIRWAQEPPAHSTSPD